MSNINNDSEYAKLYFRENANEKAVVDAKQESTEQIRMFMPQTMKTILDELKISADKHRKEIVEERKQYTEQIKKIFEEIKNNQGWIGKVWDKTKNLFGDENGSKNVAKQIKDFSEGKLSKETIENAVKEYNDGQEMAVDVTADVAAGITAIGAYSAGIAAAPFSAGGSIAVAATAAAAAGAAIKTGIKAGDASQKGKEYTLKDAGYDAATGAFSGVLAPVAGGTGGAVGKTVAKTIGVKAIQESAKITVKETAMTAGKSGIKTATTKALLNPTGYKYVGGNVAQRGAAFAAECATDGALGGATDNAFRAAINGENVLDAAVTGAVGGLILAPAIGGGVKASGKIIPSTANKVGEIVTKIPYRLKSNMHDDFHNAGLGMIIKKYSQCKNEKLTQDEIIEKMFNVKNPTKAKKAEYLETLKNIEAHIQELDSSFDKIIPRMIPIKLYRGISIDSTSATFQTIKNARVGDIITPDAGYSWASPSKEYAKSFARGTGIAKNRNAIIMEILTPAGAKLSRDFDISFDSIMDKTADINPFKSMNVVFPRNATFNVLSKEVQGNTTFIKVKYLKDTGTVDTATSTKNKN